jgi:hypothetical protein
VQNNVPESCFLLLQSLEYAEREAKREEVNIRSVEHGFAGSFGTSNKYRVMDTDRKA